jgi:uncharacterized protein YyaL (SSP411 family)
MYAIEHFYDGKRGLFYYTSDEDPELVNRPVETGDNVIPSSNSVMAWNLYLLGHLLDKGKWIALSENMLGRMLPAVIENPGFHANWACLHMHFLIPDSEVSIVGDNWKDVRNSLAVQYLPHVIFSGGTNDQSLDILQGKGKPGKTMVYVCREKNCSAPLEDLSIILSLINKNIVSLKHN